MVSRLSFPAVFLRVPRSAAASLPVLPCPPLLLRCIFRFLHLRTPAGPDTGSESRKSALLPQSRYNLSGSHKRAAHFCAVSFYFPALFVLQRHHIASVSYGIIAFVETVTVIQLIQLFHVLRQNVETGRLFRTDQELFAVNADAKHARCILRLFHSAFDFEGHNPVLQSPAAVLPYTYPSGLNG